MPANPCLLHAASDSGEFPRFFADVRVRILDHSATEITEHVRLGEVEFGISIVSSTSPELEISPLFKESFVLACRATSALAAQTSVTWQDIESVPLIRVGTLTGNRNPDR